ncbi:hypothetical protein BJP36_38875 [Moorena producens JHB]|uniref:Uncharacterized protein n=1 Tax=Moorena producens (strain JHB) TaxID=1454205 RepID=A0A9Q9SUS3_MOOP1|nr:MULTISPECIES: hypothetical protein [Moorena]WAN70033.1 hypothetical protein BJP36_38875 [Moorena producens JHB]
MVETRELIGLQAKLAFHYRDGFKFLAIYSINKLTINEATSLWLK